MPNISELIEDDWYPENEEDEKISLDDAALIWFSHGMDEDYMFGYSEEELKKSI